MAVVAAALSDPHEAAELASLRYVETCEEVGFGRRRCGRGFIYLKTDGQRLADERHIARIKSLAIPPAWTHVWICPTGNGHIQATGRDDRGRKQYIYHPRWREVRDAAKYHALVEFAEVLPRVRRRIRRDLARDGLARQKVLAAIVRLLDDTYVRIGNENYARDNDSYGLTTLRPRHVEVDGTQIEIAFRGKSGKHRRIALDHPRLARIVRACQDLAGQRLFQYRDPDGDIHAVESGDVNDYLRELTGAEVTSKHFRTWGATVTAAVALQIDEPGESIAARKRQITAAVCRAADILGNTPSVCRTSYVHPAVVEAHVEGTLRADMARFRKLARRSRPRELMLEEATLQRFLAAL